MPYDFFISYARPDREEAERLHNALVGESLVFFDAVGIQGGDLWEEKVTDALESSSVIVPLLSVNTKQAHYQMSEIQRAIELVRRGTGKQRLVPVLLDDSIVSLGLEPFQWHSVKAERGIEGIANCLLELLHGRTAWEKYEHLLNIDGYSVAYIPLLNRFGEKVVKLGLNAVEIETESLRHSLPEDFQTISTSHRDFHDDPSCGVVSYDRTKRKLSVKFCQTSYADYLRSGEHLDEPLPDDPTKTFRDKFGELVHEGSANLRPFALTNIAGAGVFVISQDNRIVVTKHSKSSHIYPGRLTFSASVCMKWGAGPHPFSQIILRCFQEINHQLNPTQLHLIGFGVDARKLFFQFSFVERSRAEMKDIIPRFGADVEAEFIPFECDVVVDRLVRECWEPSAEAALLTLCIKKFKVERVRAALRATQAQWNRRRMRDEWDYRAARSGVLPVMSIRYPQQQLETESVRYVDAVMRFLGSEAKGKTVIEVGCGVGRITERLLQVAREVTAVDLCERMIERSQEILGAKLASVNYFHGFAQDYPTRKHDLAVCSLVIIHNVNDSDFSDLIAKMCNCADSVFIFEDVTERETSSHTRIRSRGDLTTAFAEWGFKLEKEREETYRLLEDNIAFLNFRKSS